VAVVTHHPAAPLEVKAGLQELWRDLKTDASIDKLNRAYERGKQLGLEAAAERILSDG
jgi:hypothetical protein